MSNSRLKPYGSSGEMRERITIQDQTTAIDTDGSELTTWTNIASTPTMWARLEPDNVKSNLIGGRGQTKRNWNVYIRYRADLTNKMRLVCRGRSLLINGQLNPDERFRFLLLECEESNLVQ